MCTLNTTTEVGEGKRQIRFKPKEHNTLIDDFVHSYKIKKHKVETLNLKEQSTPKQFETT